MTFYQIGWFSSIVYYMVEWSLYNKKNICWNTTAEKGKFVFLITEIRDKFGAAIFNQKQLLNPSTTLSETDETPYLLIKNRCISSKTKIEENVKKNTNQTENGHNAY